MTEMDLVTIGIASFNAEQTIERAISAAQSQSYPNIEILVVDDASTDATPQIVKQMIAQDSRIRLIVHGANGGPSRSRNTIIENARGEFLMIQDHDDASLPERATKQLERLRAAESELDHDKIICFVSRHFTRLDGTEGYAQAVASDGSTLGGEQLALYILLREGLPREKRGKVASGTMLARLSTFRNLDGYDERFRRDEDSDLVVRLALAGGNCVGVPEPLVLRYVTLGPDKSRRVSLENALKLPRKHKEFLKLRGAYIAAVCTTHAVFGKRGTRRLWKVLANVARREQGSEGP